MLGVARGDEPRQAEYGGGNRQQRLAFENGEASAKQADKAKPAHHSLTNEAAMLGAGHREFISHARTLTRPSAPGNTRNAGAV